MKKITLSIFLFFTATAFAQSVDYKKTPNVKGSNYFEILKKVRAELNDPRENDAEKKKTGINALNEEERADLKDMNQFERWAYFWRDRVNADGTFPSQLEGWKNAGLLDKGTKNRSQTQKSSATAVWTNIGAQTNPDPNGYFNAPQLGRINTFWRFVDAGNAANNLLLVGAPTGGIWKSTDNGATWSPKFDTFAGIGITDIKGSSRDIAIPGVLYATTGDFDGSEVLNSIGVYKSVDQGDTWTPTGLSFSLSGGQLLGQMVVLDDNTVLVATADAIKRTTDGGVTWTDKFTSNDSRFGRMVSFGTNIVCTDSFKNIYFSTNSGNTWTAMTNSVDGGKTAVCVDDMGTFYIQDNTGQIKQLDLTGAGSTTNVAGSTLPPGYDPQQGYNMVLLKKGNLFLEGSVNGNTSTNDGATWYRSLNGYKNVAGDPGEYMHSDQHESGYLDAGNSFWNANDGGLSFINMNAPYSIQKPNIEYKTNGVINTQIYTISINPSSAINDDFMMGNQDNDGFSKENGVWVSVSAGDGVSSGIDYSNPSIRYMGGTKGSLTRSDQTLGYTGNYQGIDLPKPADGEFVWPFSLDTTNPTIAYGGFNDLYKSTTISTNNGSTTPWTINLNAGVGNPISFDNQGAKIAVVGASGLSYSSDSGANWATVNQPTGQLINSFSIDAARSTLYATVKGYSDGNKVFKSLDNGLTWTNISTGLPNILMKKVLFEQNQTDEYLFVSTELGVYYLPPLASTWTKLGSNLPNVIVNDMKINYMNNMLYVGTYGRGMWQIDIQNSKLGTTDLNISADDVLKIYPNPVTNGVLNIKLKDTKTKYNYMIYNIVGGQIATGTISSANTAIHLKNVVNGVYIIKLVNGNIVATKKFLIKN